ncbi:MAG: transcriptional regulator [Candidatus Dactylopiibacterium carminicum]|uniref:Transcriptional regulator n=1 Tax=Candidatus Dactylopiibacterium carminicum TaxID=857335 RepID=A0A272EYI7_9RHOO|nr:metalloregulator ArsR/SmtB family transcription factor [Candidatus Dactylopiibacterium carminicum]KAF7600570.1 transcriptional regulator [Candidatus Dactylopiibacterium carminicum]PAS95194.1 MAG: transcriptional regulator [Candidatus Dactylopiibacterium carminicum]PAT00575.1 MAG: transcriptional regulator [Candidatus Dactylopiibacterium carminicum]
MQALDDSALTHLAAYFRALSEPTRLRILNTLRDGEKNVGQITELTGCGQANVSKHLALLFEAGLVTRSAQGTSVFYAIADEATFELCDIVCGNVARIVERQFASATALKRQLGTIGRS